MARVLEAITSRPWRSIPRGDSSDWERPSGPLTVDGGPRSAQPTFIYRGYGDEHWRGQTCHLVGAEQAEQRTVVLACGCQATVPWWTLEPIR